MIEVDGHSFRSQEAADQYVNARDMLTTVKKSPPSEQRNHMLRDCERAVALSLPAAA